MWNFENLFRTLAKLIDLTLDSHLLNGVLDLLNVDHSLVSEGMEQIEGLDCFLSALFVAEDQIDPFVQIVRNILRL